MSELMTVQDDGTIIVGLDADWTPVPVEEAVLVKVIEPNGTVRFLVPVRDKGEG